MLIMKIVLSCSELERYISASVLALNELRSELHVWSGTSVTLWIQFQIHVEKNDTITRYLPESVTSRRELSVCEKPTYGEFYYHSQVWFKPSSM